MVKRRKLRLLLGAALAAALFTGAAGASVPPGVPSTGPGQTMVGVQTADMDSSSLSFTVPLYMTVAATVDAQSRPQVVVPDGYMLKNTTGSIPDGTYPDIAVTEVAVAGVPGGSWNMRETPVNPKDICVTIGGLTLPDVDAASETPVFASITASDNKFYNYTAGTFKGIPGGPDAPALELPVKGQLAAGYASTEARAAAQFRILYTVSLLDAGGKPVGVYYDGPAKEDAETASPAAVIVPPAPAGP